MSWESGPGSRVQLIQFLSPTEESGGSPLPAGLSRATAPPPLAPLGLFCLPLALARQGGGLSELFHWLFLQYVSEVVIGAPYSVTAELLNHFKVRLCLEFS